MSNSIQINVAFSSDGWKEYRDWQTNNRKIYVKINRLIKSVKRDGLLKGIGEPEILRYHQGLPIYSRRITQKDRLYIEYRGILVIIGCKGHY